MKRKPVFEYTDKRVSDRYAEEERQRLRERDKAEEKMGHNYFTNNKGEVDETRRTY
jgi:hypothetical protein